MSEAVKLLELKFSPPAKIRDKALRINLLLRQNLEQAVILTILYGIALIQADTPVDTGLLRASIAGQFGEATGPKAAEGRAKSLTRIDPANLEGTIGTAVEYARHVEFGWRIVVTAVTGRKYYKRDGTGGKGKIRRVEGKAMFRKNLPLIRKFFKQKCQEAVRLALQGKAMEVY